MSRAFAADCIPTTKAKRVRKLFIPTFEPDEWRRTIGHLAFDWIVDESNVDTSQVTRVGSLDVGTVSYGWGVVEFAPLARTSSREPMSSNVFVQAQSSSLLDQSVDCRAWIRVPKASEWKNVGLGETTLEFLPFVFRLVHWSFESMFDSGSRPTKEQAVSYAVRQPYRQMLEKMDSMGVRTVVIEQYLGMQNILATCLSHAFYALVLMRHPEWRVEFIAPQLTVPLFVSILSSVPDEYAFAKSRVVDLKEKPYKKYASGLCASFVLLLSNDLVANQEILSTWRRVPCDPDPKYDDISDYMWNAIAFWNKYYAPKKKTTRKRVIPITLDLVAY